MAVEYLLRKGQWSLEGFADMVEFLEQMDVWGSDGGAVLHNRCVGCESASEGCPRGYSW